MNINAAAGTIVYGNKRLRLPQMQMQLFVCLYKNIGKPVSREALMFYLYQQSPHEPGIKILHVMICHLRRKLAPLGIRILTVWGFGYVLDHGNVESVRWEEAVA